MNIVQIENLVKRYNDVLALDNLNLYVKKGQTFGLLGPNGAGKTTLINCLMGLTTFDSGEIYIFDKNINKHLNYIKQDIGIVPQEISLYLDLTVYENLSFFGSLYNLKGSVLKERISWALNFVGLYEKKKVLVKNLSGGMKRRLNIACSLLHRPTLIVMDEPTVGIDALSRRLILDSVKQLNKEGATIIYTSHYIEEVDEICTYITILNKGRVVISGTKDELKNMISGDEIIKIKTDTVNYSLEQNLKTLKGLKGVIVNDKELILTVQKGMVDIKKIVNIVSEFCSIDSINFERPTLESIYLIAVGKEIKEEGQG